MFNFAAICCKPSPAPPGAAPGNKKEAAASALMQQPPGGAPLSYFVFSAFSSPSRGVTYTVVYTS